VPPASGGVVSSGSGGELAGKATGQEMRVSDVSQGAGHLPARLRFTYQWQVWCLLPGVAGRGVRHGLPVEVGMGLTAGRVRSRPRQGSPRRGHAGPE
jgi:hypothetical protein